MALTIDQIRDDQLTVSQIDEELARLTERILYLRSLRNTHAPIFRLPPEILSKIITIYKDQVENDHEQSKSHRKPSPLDRWDRTYRWIVISHVCRHWRDVTLRSPSFWSTIYMPTKSTSLEFVDYLVKRSDLSLRTISTLSLQLAVGKEPDEELDLGCLSRFLCYNSGTGGKILRPIRQLELFFYAERGCSNHSNRFSPKSAIPLLVDPTLSENVDELDALEDLAIVYDFPLYHPVQLLLSQYSINRVSNLKSLSLEWRAGDYSWTWGMTYPRITWDEFRLAMASFQQLQHLNLVGALDDLQNNPDANTGPIYNRSVAPHLSNLIFPHLQSLGLCGYYARFVKFFSSLLIPATTRIDIASSQTMGTDETMVELFERLSHIFSHTPHSSHSSPSCSSCSCSSHIPSSVERLSDDFGVELAIHQSPKSTDLRISIDPNRRDGAMDNPNIYQVQSINVTSNRIFPNVDFRALFDGIARHIQPLTSPKHHHSYRQRYICFSYRDDRFSECIVQAFSGFKGLNSICISAMTPFGRALGRGIINCGCIEGLHDLEEGIGSGAQPWMVQTNHDDRSWSLCHECRSFLGSYFPELRKLTIVGPCDELQELEQWVDEELGALKRVLWYFDAAGRRLELLEFKRWSSVKTEDWEPYCDKVSWTHD